MPPPRAGFIPGMQKSITLMSKEEKPYDRINKCRKKLIKYIQNTTMGLPWWCSG